MGSRSLDDVKADVRAQAERELTKLWGLEGDAIRDLPVFPHAWISDDERNARATCERLQAAVLEVLKRGEAPPTHAYYDERVHQLARVVERSGLRVELECLALDKHTVPSDRAMLTNLVRAWDSERTVYRGPGRKMADSDRTLALMALRAGWFPERTRMQLGRTTVGQVIDLARRAVKQVRGK